MPKSSYSLARATPSKKSKNEKEVLFDEFKWSVKALLRSDEFLHQDHFLRKWLVAREWNVCDAIDMFNKNHQVRQSMKLDEILDTYKTPEVLDKYMVGSLINGYDKEGSPIWVERYGNLDLKGILHSCTKTELEMYKFHDFENIVNAWKQISKETGQIPDGLVVIMDLENFRLNMLWKPGITMYLHLVKLLEDNYPETMKILFVVNAPRIFPILYNLCRPLLSERTKRKIHVLGSNYSTYLLRYIEEDQLPKYLGGTRIDSDGNPLCISSIRQGGIVPEAFYRENVIENESMITVVVPSRDEVNVDVAVNTVPAILKWEFYTNNYDIGFGVTYIGDASKEESEIVPVTRVTSHIVSEDGFHQCDQTGIYRLKFDNTFSWSRSKQVQYIAEVVYENKEATEEVDQLTLDVSWDEVTTQSQTTHL